MSAASSQTCALPITQNSPVGRENGEESRAVPPVAVSGVKKLKKRTTRKCGCGRNRGMGK